jgi:maltooligosyltrehalose trehalohydrolase
VGNRALGERLIHLADPDALKAAITLMLLCPMIPMLFMGEEWGEKHPFLYFTDHEDDLAKAVRDGRRAEFAHLTQFQDPTVRQQIPDPNAINTFLSSRIAFTGVMEIGGQDEGEESEHKRWWNFYQQLLTLRRTYIIPHLPDVRSADVTIMGPRAVRAAWMLGNGSQLGIYLNLSPSPVIASPPWEDEHLLYSCNLAESDYQQGILPPNSAVAILRH